VRSCSVATARPSPPASHRPTGANPRGRPTLVCLYSSAELLDAIRRWTHLYGSAPARIDWDPSRARKRCDPDVAAAKLERYRARQWPSAATLRSHFGSFSAALDAAGVEPRPRRTDVRWTDEAIIEALRDLAYQHDRPPRPDDLDNSAHELPGIEVIALRFGSWHEAITAAGLAAD